ncbi:hypothetical protein PSHT_03276 [Puccinia striiformis]|uniref:Uncharacterized protein n=1 Tax=Puccinia striiformis TaxID=27350 RepID=A0A2S4WFV2_9BASI|nr:hypothetical protein PSHT_03276 [Puccinia striiformis]
MWHDLSKDPESTTCQFTLSVSMRCARRYGTECNETIDEALKLLHGSACDIIQDEWQQKRPSLNLRIEILTPLTTIVPQRDVSALRQHVIKLANLTMPLIKITRIFYNDFSSRTRKKLRLTLYTELDSKTLTQLHESAATVTARFVVLVRALGTSYDNNSLAYDRTLIPKQVQDISQTLDSTLVILATHPIPLPGQISHSPSEKHYKARLSDLQEQWHCAVKNFLTTFLSIEAPLHFVVFSGLGLIDIDLSLRQAPEYTMADSETESSSPTALVLRMLANLKWHASSQDPESMECQQLASIWKEYARRSGIGCNKTIRQAFLKLQGSDLDIIQDEWQEKAASLTSTLETLTSHTTTPPRRNRSAFRQHVIKLAHLAMPLIKLIRIFYNDFSSRTRKNLRFTLDTELNSETLTQLHQSAAEVTGCFAVLGHALRASYADRSLAYGRDFIPKQIQVVSQTLDSTLVILAMYLIPLPGQTGHSPRPQIITRLGSSPCKERWHCAIKNLSTTLLSFEGRHHQQRAAPEE